MDKYKICCSLFDMDRYKISMIFCQWYFESACISEPVTWHRVTATCRLPSMSSLLGLCGDPYSSSRLHVAGAGIPRLSGSSDVLGWHQHVVGWHSYVVGRQRCVIRLQRYVVEWQRYVIGWQRYVVGWQRYVVGWQRYLGWQRYVIGWQRYVVGWQRYVIE